MPVPSAVISVAISCERQQLVEARVLDVQDLALAAAGSPGTCGRGPAWPSRRRSRPRRCRARTAPDRFSWQSASLPGRPMPSSTPLRRVISRALRAASRARAASTILPAMILRVVRAARAGTRRSFAATISSTDRPHFGGDQLVLGLRRELRLGHLHRQHAGQAFAHVVAGGLDLGLLGELVLLDVLVERARHRRAQAGEVRAAVALRDVVGEAQHVLL